MDFTATYIPANRDHTMLCPRCGRLLSGKYLQKLACPSCGSTLSAKDAVCWYDRESEPLIAKRIRENRE